MKMRSWIFIFLVVPYSHGIQMRETEYECGAHGRFEYCIDGVPGCVIGCHCHPGYYFDTDTKICEPNIKLSQNFRRNYDYIEPTRIYLAPTPPTVEEPATTAKNAVDEKIDIITKDADDLGDWLYNQFFKTIENQVMNETKDDSVLTRRSGNSPSFVRKPTRRSHRYWRARRKKKRKKKGLKSKLLRITEDDSLFDSSSSSNSDDSSASSASSSASEGSREMIKEKKRQPKDDHGHKKIVVFNKRPKPPLPSFIFLPNMETPFFPPIGLPAPPMPMYPMVPVPPMMGPYQYPAPTPPCDTVPNKTNGQASAPPAAEKPTEATTKPASKPVNAEHTTPPADENAEDDTMPPEENTGDTPDNPPDDAPETIPEEPTPDEPSPDDTPPDAKLLRSRSKKRRGPRKKLVQQLRDKLKRKNKLQNYLTNGYQGPPIVPPGFISKHLPNLRQKSVPEIGAEDDFAGLEDVDFKYLSQLIHRANLNKTNQKHPTTPSDIKNMLDALPNRRNLDTYANQITQVLNDLANQPKNRNLDPQPENDVPNPLGYNVSNQPVNSAPSQPTYYAANQLNYNSPNLPTNAHKQFPYNVPSLPTFNIPRQLSYNIPQQPGFNIPHQTSNNTLRQPTDNAPLQTVDAPHLPMFNEPSQSSYNVPNQPTYVSLNQPPHKVPYRNKIEETDDSYYANLGRQIASMIRNIDGDKEVDIEIKSSLNIPNNPVIPGQTGSRSYWERSVRSPYTHIMNSFKKHIDNLKSSNEDLFNLESKVEIAASTEPTLSLHELENIIKKIQKTKSTFIKKSISTRVKESKSIFNVNLLPGNDRQLQLSDGQISRKAEDIRPNNSFNDLSVRTDIEHTTLQMPTVKSSLFRDFMMYTLKASLEKLHQTTPKPIAYQSSTYAPRIIPTRNPIPVPVPQMRYKMPNRFLYAYTVLPLPAKTSRLTNIHPHYPNIEPRYMPATTTRPYYHQMSPLVLNHKSVKYYDGVNSNQYLFEKASIPVPVAPQVYPSNRVSQASGNRYETYRKRVEPSYFHHEIHHFDYFDDIVK